jgi:predicted nucleotidyltransferase
MIGVFKAYPNIAVAYIFGSRVYGKKGKEGDYDVALLFKDDHSLDEQLDITLRLAQVFDVDLDAIDVIELNHAPVELAYEVIAKENLFIAKTMKAG